MDQDRPGFAPPPEGSAPEGSAPVPGAPDVIASEPTTGARRSRVTAGVVLAAVGIGALGITGVAYAATSSPSPTGTPAVPGYGDGDHDGDGPGYAPGGGQQVPGMPGGGKGHGGPGGPGIRGLGGNALHGELVVPQADGSGYQTMQVQRGTVTAVSSTSITVKSEDGFTATYDVTSTTEVNRDGAIADIAKGAEVGVVALKSGGSLEAQRIVDTAAFTGGRGGHDGDGPGMPGAPSTSTTAGATT